MILLKLSFIERVKTETFRLRGKFKRRRIPQQWIMINGTGRTTTAPPAGGHAGTETSSQRPRCQRWVLKASWKKDYGCLFWPSGPLPAPQVCKLLKAAEPRLSPESFFTQSTLTRWQDWVLFKGKPPLRQPPPPQTHSASLKYAGIITWCEETSQAPVYVNVRSV